jgi:integrase
VQAGRLSGVDVARVVKKLALRAGLDAAKYAGHSLRAGHATSAAMGGASERSIMSQTGHRSVQMVRRYIRYGSLFRDNSAGKLGCKGWQVKLPSQRSISLISTPSDGLYRA